MFCDINEISRPSYFTRKILRIRDQNHDRKFGDMTPIVRGSRLDLRITFNNFIFFSHFLQTKKYHNFFCDSQKKNKNCERFLEKYSIHIALSKIIKELKSRYTHWKRSRGFTSALQICSWNVQNCAKRVLQYQRNSQMDKRALNGKLSRVNKRSGRSTATRDRYSCSTLPPSVGNRTSREFIEASLDRICNENPQRRRTYIYVDERFLERTCILMQIPLCTTT